MAMDTTTLKYTKEHEWVKVEGNKVRIGITDHAQKALGDVVFVELPAVGDELESGKAFGVIESVKAVSDVYAPVSGTVTLINEILLDSPETINQDAYGEGWMIELELTDPGEVDGLLDEAQYQQFLQEEEH